MYGDNDFFMMDTRAFRSRSSADRLSPSKTMLGKRQLAALKTWAQRDCTGFKFILSPSAMILMAPGNKSQTDAWHDYPLERNAILDFLEEKNIKNVVFLSGDIHIPFVAELRPGVFEFSLSPIAGFTQFKSKFGANYKSDAKIWKEKLHWKDDRFSSLWRPASFNAIVNVDTTSSPKTLTVDYYSFEDEDTPLYTKKLHYSQGKMEDMGNQK